MNRLYVYLKEPDVIEVSFFGAPFKTEGLWQDEKRLLPLKESAREDNGNEKKIAYRLAKELELGHSYFLKTDIGLFPLDVSKATTFPHFDERFLALDTDFGAAYSKEKTCFRLFAPLASKVILKIKKEGDERLFVMGRHENGVWEKVLEGDCRLAQYTYLVTNNEIVKESIDPYAKASGPNSLYSVVFSPDDFDAHSTKGGLSPLHRYTDAIIYEASVRDFTSDPHTDIENKGRFLGLTEEGRKTLKGHPAGLDYLKALGISHLQLLPIFDFKTVDELNPRNSYNWGYDPAQYFVPEGSFASDLDDPYSRIRDLKFLIKTLHQNGIRVVMDVVFNHVYDWPSSSFEKVIPNYYFRHKKDGSLSNASWCGDDLMTERPMVRKLLLDAMKFWIDFYDIDGFRFDLMGLIDIETIKEIEAYAHQKDPSFILYGEGWKMGEEGKAPLLSMDKAKETPRVAFFNDRFREANKRFLSGEKASKEAYKAAFYGNANPMAEGETLFLSPVQSVNYIECHDNMTFYDYLSYKRGIVDEAELLTRSKLGVSSVLFSFGIPFLHMGEEIGLSKFGEDNTYNKGDRYNAFRYEALDERWDAFLFAKNCIALRKSLQCVYSLDPSSFSSLTKSQEIAGGLVFFLKCDDPSSPYKEYDLFINPSDEATVYTLEADADILFMPGESLPVGIKGQSLLIPKRSLLVAALEKSH